MGKTYRFPVVLPTTGTSGSFNIQIPFPIKYVGVLNQSSATIGITEHQVFAQPPDALIFNPLVGMSAPLNDTVQAVTVFWSSTGALSTTNNSLVILFDMEPINIQVGILSSGGTPSNVNVTGGSVSVGGTVQSQLVAGTALAGKFSISNSAGSSEIYIGGTTDAQIDLNSFATASRLQAWNGVSYDRLRVDSQKNLLVGLRSSGGIEPFITGYGSFDSNSVADKALLTANYLFGFNGTTWDRLRVDANKNLQVSLRNSAGTEPSLGTGFPSSDSWSTTSSSLATASFMGGFNGTTWDRLRVDANKNLQVSLRSSGGIEPLITNINGDSVSQSNTALFTGSALYAYDGTTNWQRLRVDSAKNLNVTANGMSVFPSIAQVNVSTTAVGMRVGAGDLVNRKSISIRNMGSVDCYIGGSGVTSTTGFLVKAGEIFSIDQQPGTTCTFYAITASGTTAVCLMEVA